MRYNLKGVYRQLYFERMAGHPYYVDFLPIVHVTSNMWQITWRRGDKDWAEKSNWIYASWV